MIDWYLLGLIIFEFLTGAPPYYNHSRETLFENIKKANLKFPSYVSPNAQDLISKVFFQLIS